LAWLYVAPLVSSMGEAGFFPTTKYSYSPNGPTPDERGSLHSLLSHISRFCVCFFESEFPSPSSHHWNYFHTNGQVAHPLFLFRLALYGSSGPQFNPSFSEGRMKAGAETELVTETAPPLWFSFFGRLLNFWKPH